MTIKLIGTVDEAAEVLDISRNSAYQGVAEGTIPSMRVGKRILVLWRPLMRTLGVVEENEDATALAAEAEDAEARDAQARASEREVQRGEAS